MTPDCPPTCPQSASASPLAGPQLALPPGLRAGGPTGKSTAPAQLALIGQSVAAGLSEKEQLAKALRLSVKLATQISAEEINEAIDISNELTASALDAEARAAAVATEVADREAAKAVSTRQAACASSIDQRDEAVPAPGLAASRLSADVAEALGAIDTHGWPDAPYLVGHEAQLQAFITQDRLVQFALKQSLEYMGLRCVRV